jgi:hypothetical protein
VTLENTLRSTMEWASVYSYKMALQSGGRSGRGLKNLHPVRIQVPNVSHKEVGPAKPGNVASDATQVLSGGFRNNGDQVSQLLLAVPGDGE